MTETVVARRKAAARRTKIDDRARTAGVTVAYLLKLTIEQTSTLQEAADSLDVSLSTLNRYRDRYRVEVKFD
jgi:hypothetical protein